jgi:hypothetical protein
MEFVHFCDILMSSLRGEKEGMKTKMAEGKFIGLDEETRRSTIFNEIYLLLILSLFVGGSLMREM